MTDVMNFFESLRMYTSLAPGHTKRQDIRLSIELKNAGERLQAEAETEWKRGEVSRAFAVDATNSNRANLVSDLKAISAWHFRRSSDLYRTASEKYSEAAAIHTKHSKDLVNAARKLAAMSAKAEEIAVAIEREFQHGRT